MEGFDAFRLWVAYSQHFKNKRYDIRKSKGGVKCKFETYLARKDYYRFEEFARKFTKKEFIYYLVANFMYGNDQMVWDAPIGIANYNQYITRRKNLKELLATDFKTLMRMNVRFDDGITIVRALTRNQISFESVVILNHYANFTKDFDNLPQKIILDPLLLRIEKSIDFIEVPLDVEHYILNKLKSYRDKYE